MTRKIVLAVLLTALAGSMFAVTLKLPGQGSIAFTQVDDQSKPTSGTLTKDQNLFVPGQGTYLFQGGSTINIAWIKVSGKVVAAPVSGTLAKNLACNLPGQGSYTFAGGKEIEFYYTNLGAGMIGYFQSAYLTKDSTFFIPGQGSQVFTAESDMVYRYKVKKGEVFTYVISGTLKKNVTFAAGSKKKAVTAGSEVTFEYSKIGNEEVGFPAE